MLGAIIGDIAGSAYEFNNTFDYDFELFPAECSFTDDTICTVAIADALLLGEDYQSALLRWCRSYPHPKGAYGGRFSQWIHAAAPKPYGSFGNGSAMRVSAVAWWFEELDDVLREAEKTAIVTHNHPEGVKGAVAVAHAIHFLRHGGDREGLTKIAEHYYPTLLHQPFPRGRFDETCQGTVPLCFQILLKSKDFEDAIRLAVSHGGDSDTIGAIVGAMAEAMYYIPEEIYATAISLLDREIAMTVSDFFSALNQRQVKRGVDFSL